MSEATADPTVGFTAGPTDGRKMVTVRSRVGSISEEVL